jgi:hypothetical protein
MPHKDVQLLSANKQLYSNKKLGSTNMGNAIIYYFPVLTVRGSSGLGFLTVITKWLSCESSVSPVICSADRMLVILLENVQEQRRWQGPQPLRNSALAKATSYTCHSFFPL